MKQRIVKLRAGFLATTVPGSECLNRDGQPIGAEFDEYAAMPTAEELNAPLRGGLAGLTVAQLEVLGRLYVPNEHELMAQRWVGLEGLTQDELREISGLNQVTP